MLKTKMISSKNSRLDKYFVDDINLAIRKNFQNLADDLGDSLVNIEMLASLASDDSDSIGLEALKKQINILADKFDTIISHETQTISLKITEAISKEEIKIFD